MTKGQKLLILIVAILAVGSVAGAAAAHSKSSRNAARTAETTEDDEKKDKKSKKQNTEDTEATEIETEETETEPESEIAEADGSFDFFSMYDGGVYSYMRSEDSPYRELAGGTIIVYLDGHEIDALDAEGAFGDEDPNSYAQDITWQKYLWETMDPEERTEADVVEDPYGVAGYYYYRIYQSEASEDRFAYVSLYGVGNPPESMVYEGESIPVVGVEFVDYVYAEEYVIPRYAQLVQVSTTFVRELRFENSGKPLYFQMHDSTGISELTIPGFGGELWVDVSQCEGLEALNLPDDGSVRYVDLYRDDDLKRLNSETDGTFSLPAGTKYASIMQMPGIKELYLPDSIEQYEINSNDAMTAVWYQGTPYSDLAALQTAVGTNAAVGEDSMEMDEIVDDVKALDADDSNKTGEEFSFVGQDYWQNPIFYKVWYEDGFWRVKTDLYGENREIHSTGYFDANFVYHED